MIWFLAYTAGGALVGLLSGMLGIGGGMTLVPILAALFEAQALAAGHEIHLALGTAMASAVVTAAASVRAHNLRGAVDWGIAARLAPGMVLGSLLSSAASGWIAQRQLALAFAVIVYAGATQMLLGRQSVTPVRLPGRTVTLLIGLLIGVVCGLVSAGGAFLTVPWMLLCGVPMITAIGTGAAVAVPVLFVGTIGYVVGGWQTQGLPRLSVGFVYLPALVAILLASSPLASVGAHLAHRLPVAVLKRIFAVLLYILATHMALHYW
ncbi:MAG TPA: sulfite exporter TauE/SafE family protein [Burkholderiaceae bacterium]